MHEIDWAFAGVVNRADSGGSWIHWLDSRTDSPESDSGTFETLPNGDVMERGTMRDKNGVIRPYEEIWRDEIVTKSLVAVLVAQSFTAEENRQFSKLPNEYLIMGGQNIISAAPPGCVGMIIRVGDWCQGILKSQDRIVAERWHYLRNPVGNQWSLEFQTGQGELPCDKVCDWLDEDSKGGSKGEFYQIGDPVTIGDVIWTLVEFFDVRPC